MEQLLNSEKGTGHRLLLPIQLVRPIKGALFWFVDREAACLLDLWSQNQSKKWPEPGLPALVIYDHLVKYDLCRLAVNYHYKNPFLHNSFLISESRDTCCRSEKSGTKIAIFRIEKLTAQFSSAIRLPLFFH